MRVFIVGATGVIGRELVPRLLERGDKVVALVRSFDRAQHIAVPGVELVEGDLLALTSDDLVPLLRGVDAIAHLATALRATSPGFGTTNTSVALRTTGVSNLLEAAARAEVRHFVMQSIAFAYEPGGDEWIEESRPLLRNPDGTPRLIEQMEALVQGASPSLGWTILRGGTFVGADTFQDDVIARLRAGTEAMPGDGSHWVSFIHASDYATAVLAALTRRGGVYNITAEPIRQRDYLVRLSSLLGVPAPPANPAEATPNSYRCSNAAALESLGWRPTRGIWPEPQRLLPPSQ